MRQKSWLVTCVPLLERTHANATTNAKHHSPTSGHIVLGDQIVQADFLGFLSRDILVWGVGWDLVFVWFGTHIISPLIYWRPAVSSRAEMSIPGIVPSNRVTYRSLNGTLKVIHYERVTLMSCFWRPAAFRLERRWGVGRFDTSGFETRRLVLKRDRTRSEWGLRRPFVFPSVRGCG